MLLSVLKPVDSLFEVILKHILYINKYTYVFYSQVEGVSGSSTLLLLFFYYFLFSVLFSSLSNINYLPIYYLLFCCSLFSVIYILSLFICLFIIYLFIWLFIYQFIFFIIIYVFFFIYLFSDSDIVLFMLLSVLL